MFECMYTYMHMSQGLGVAFRPVAAVNNLIKRVVVRAH
jgi:hypothetical protein